jgi:hypothetical protein
MTDALTRIGILVIALIGIGMGVFWFLLRPGVYRRGLESVSKNRSQPSHLPRFVIWGMALAVTLTFGLFVLSFHSDRLARRGAADTEGASRYQKTVTPRDPALDETSLPASFDSTYVVFKRPMKRDWRQNSNGTWTESYGGEVSNIFETESTLNLNGCIGTLLKKRGETSFEVFVPSSGCAPVLRFRNNGGPWQVLGPVENASASN